MCAAVVCKTPRPQQEEGELLLDECLLEGAPLILRCNTMPVQQAEAMEQLLRQVGDSGVCGWAAGQVVCGVTHSSSPFILRCSTIPVQQAEAMEHLLRHVGDSVVGVVETNSTCANPHAYSSSACFAFSLH